MGGQGCAARGHGYGPCVVRRVRHVVPSQVVPEGVGEEPEEAGVAGGGGCGWGRGPLAVVGVEVPAVGAVGEAVRGSQADPVVWVAGQGCLWQPLANAEGTCDGWRLVVPVDGRRRGGVGAGGARMLVGVCAVPVVPVCAVPVLCSVDGV